MYIGHGLHRSDDWGKSWQQIDTGLSDRSYVHDIIKAGQYLVCSHYDGIFRSANWGASWERVLESPDGVVLDFMVVGDVIYCAGVGVDNERTR